MSAVQQRPSPPVSEPKHPAQARSFTGLKEVPAEAIARKLDFLEHQDPRGLGAGGELADDRPPAPKVQGWFGPQPDDDAVGQGSQQQQPQAPPAPAPPAAAASPSGQQQPQQGWRGHTEQRLAQVAAVEKRLLALARLQVVTFYHSPPSHNIARIAMCSGRVRLFFLTASRRRRLQEAHDRKLADADATAEVALLTVECEMEYEIGGDGSMEPPPPAKEDGRTTWSSQAQPAATASSPATPAAGQPAEAAAEAGLLGEAMRRLKQMESIAAELESALAVERADR